MIRLCIYILKIIYVYFFIYSKMCKYIHYKLSLTYNHNGIFAKFEDIFRSRDFPQKILLYILHIKYVTAYKYVVQIYL